MAFHARIPRAMASTKYPLAALLEHRGRGVDAATAEFGQSIRQREAGEAAERRAEAAQRAAEAEQARIRAEEAARLLAGGVSVAELARQGAWAAGAATELERLAAGTEAAATRASGLRDEETEARGKLARSMADRDVVARDRERFVAGVKKAALAAEEEAAEEAHGGKRA